MSLEVKIMVNVWWVWTFIQDRFKIRVTSQKSAHPDGVLPRRLRQLQLRQRRLHLSCALGDAQLAARRRIT